MKRTYEMIRNLLIFITILIVLQIVLLTMNPDVKHIVFTSIAGAGFIAILVLFIIAKKEMNKIILEYQNEEYEIRVVDYDDYQIIRELLCEEPLSNSEREVELLSEYEKITADFVRIRYHYLILKKNKAIGLIYVKNEKECFIVEIKNIMAEEEKNIKELILKIANERNKIVSFAIEKDN